MGDSDVTRLKMIEREMDLRGTKFLKKKEDWIKG